MINIISMIREDFPHVNAISINQHGKPLLKEYFNGFNNNDIFKIGCIFKSIVSAMVGIALQDNKIQSLDQKILNYYPEIVLSDIDKILLYSP